MMFNLGKIVSVPQGSDLWHALRGKRRTASEAPAAAGKSKYMTRNELLSQKATGLVPEVDAHQQRIFDDGHRAEAEARPHAEALIDDELFPVVLDDAEGGFLASMDGLTIDRKIGFEHKMLSESLAKQIEAGELEEHYRLQLDQQFALSGAEKILFVASDGTKESFKYLWVERDESRFKLLLSVWEQFDTDLSQYEAPEAEQPKATGTSPDQLPALNIQATGMVTASNLDEFKAHAKAVLSEINTELVTDEHFATAEKTVKWCKETEKRLATAKESLLSQTSSIYDALNTIDSVNGDVREMRLMLDKAVKQQKESRKAEILANSRQAFSDFLRGLRVAEYMPSINADFAGAIKGLKTMSSVQSACDDELARAKIEANEIAEVIATNQAHLDKQAGSHRFLFNDFGQICMKPDEDFAAIVKSRIADHKETEQKRLDAEREKIRQEEEAKAERIANEKARREEAITDEAAQEQHEERQRPAGSRTDRVAPEPPMPDPNEMVEVLAKHYGVSFQKAASWLAGVEWKVTA